MQANQFLKGFQGISQPFSTYGLLLRFALVGDLSPPPDIDR